MNASQEDSRIAYIGPTGAGFGFQLSGLDVEETSAPAEALSILRKLIQTNRYGIIFIDESLAEPSREAIDKLNEATLPAIMLLQSPGKPSNIAATQLQQLMVRAIGSDILK